MNYFIVLMVCSLLHCSSTQRQRRFYSTKEELELSKTEPRIDAKPCNDEQPISVFIHSAGRSKGKYFERRVVQRNSWVPELKSLNISIYFVIALNIDEKVNQELKEESDKYQDMIQFSFIDDYYNLTIKALSLIRWINKKCLSYYILKTDDDVVVNSRLLMDKLSDLKPGINGMNPIICGEVVNRDPNNFKYYTPYDCYPNVTFPCFAWGPAYMMVGNITHTLLETFDRFPYCVIQIDDVFWVGIIAEMGGISRHSSSLMRHSGCTDVCHLFEWPVITHCESPLQTKEFWSKWKSDSYTLESCRLSAQILFYIKVILIVVIVVIVIVLVGTALFFGYRYYFKNKDNDSMYSPKVR